MFVSWRIGHRARVVPGAAGPGRGTDQIALRVLGGAHPIKTEIEHALRYARAKLRARETPPPQSGALKKWREIGETIDELKRDIENSRKENEQAPVVV